MQLIRGLNRWPGGDAGCVLTIGNFDGVHLGHQAIFKQLVKTAKALNLPACVMSFEPLPREYFMGAAAPGRLQGLRDKVDSIRACGIERLLLMPFDAELAHQEASAFITATLAGTLQARHLLIGDDFRFGARRQGDFTLLEQQAATGGYTLEQSATVLVDQERVSSTRVREALGHHQLDAARQLLGRPYRISGRVIHGEKVGRQLGFATANVALQDHRPALRGVFAVRATDTLNDRSYPAVANLGERPTVGGRKLLLEVHVLDAAPELYGHHLKVDFLHHIRVEQRFASLDELKAQIARDAEAARDWLT